jgi:hypothetical protein
MQTVASQPIFKAEWAFCPPARQEIRQLQKWAALREAFLLNKGVFYD